MNTASTQFLLQDTIRADVNDDLRIADDHGVLVSQQTAERIIAGVSDRSWDDISAILNRTTPGQRVQIGSIVAERLWSETPLPPVIAVTIDGRRFEYNDAIRHIVSMTGQEPNLVRADLLHAAALGQDTLVFEPDSNPDLYRPRAIEVTAITNTRDQVAQAA